jgi:aspartate carbamoyltransferase catalytic subunit
MASLFYEPSTRTRFSFESAMLKLGGSVISTENAKEFSSAAKGESLEDSIKVTGNYADVIVLRHFEEGASLKASQVSPVPIINAGDGRGQHPTQALLDIYTIQKELGRLNGIHVTMVGDLKNGRTVRSLAYLLGKYRKVKLTFVSPKALKMGSDVKDYLERHKVEYEETENWKEALSKADVIYQTRVQKERFPSLKEYKKYQGTYVLTRREVRLMKKGSIILHPLPRVGEITGEVDKLAPAKYFKQAEYGLYMRMAILEYVLGK